MKRTWKFLSLLGIAVSFLAGCNAGTSYKKVESDTLYVNKVKGITDDFIMGMDASSVPSLEDSGVKFYNFDGEEEDVFKILHDNGVNYIRVRVWNDPFDAQGHGYGGGNVDITRAVEIGKRVTENGMKLLVDFHYSDFWADPSKQKAPKAWEGMDLFEKQEALYDYTLDCMKQFKAAKVNVGMVQIGNETTNGMAGETRFDYFASLVNEGAKAVRKIYNKALIAVHFTNPEKADRYEYYAEQLAKNEVKYDVFGTSYYPYWHGTLENLSEVLGNIASTYKKKVMVLETSYCFTEEDTDFGGSTISKNNGYDYPFTIAGQANHVINLAQTIANIKNGIGICYWEGTWISVGTSSWAENKAKWEQFGSGWASDYAAEYDDDVAAYGGGGSVVDNQAFFDANGKPLESLKVFNLVRFGNEVEKYIDGIEDAYLTHYTDEQFTLPETVNVIMSDNSRQPIEVNWEDFDLQAAKDAGNGKHTIKGTAGGQTVYCYLTLLEYNFLTNYGFEDNEVDETLVGDKPRYKATGWTVTNNGEEINDNHRVEPTAENPQTGKMAFHFWAQKGDTINFDVEQTVALSLPGTYKYQISVMGGVDPNAITYIYVKINGTIQYKSANGALTGYENWSDMKLTGIEFKAGDTLTVGFHMETVTAGSWGDFDDAMFNLVKAA